MAMRTVGIDLAIRGDHVARILGGDGELLGSPIRFRFNAPDLKKLVRDIRDGLKPTDQVPVMMEPTGMSWFPVSHWLSRAGCNVIRVKGQRVKALRRYLCEHAKTDLLDAQLLGTMPTFGERGLTPLYLPNAQQHALSRLTKQRRRYQEETCSIRRRMRDLIRWASPALEDALPELNTLVSFAILERYFNPRLMRRLGRARLTAFVRAHVGGKHPAHGPFAEHLAERLLDAARATIDLYPHDEVDFDLLQLEVQQEIQRARLLQDQIKQLDGKIEGLYTTLHPQDHLRTIPGLGTVLSPSILGVLHSWKRFSSQRRIRGFSGLFPRRSESGGQDKPSQRIGKGGNNRLKRDLLLAADVARQIDPELARVYHTMMVDKGKHHRQALCAVATRLMNRIYAVLKEGRPYVLRDLEARPITVAQGKELVLRHFEVPTSVRQRRRRGARSAA
jgi:transposase